VDFVLELPTPFGRVVVYGVRRNDVRLAAHRVVEELQAGGSDGSLRSSISHSGDMALVAQGEGVHVGVDVERPRQIRHPDRLAERMLTPAELTEWRELTGVAGQVELVRWWTRKEACVKLTGAGLRTPLHQVVLGRANGSGRRRATGDGVAGRDVEVLDLALPDGFVGALAWAGLPLSHAGIRRTTTPYTGGGTMFETETPGTETPPTETPGEGGGEGGDEGGGGDVGGGEGGGATA
jgi:phosphopantetheinyl transferase (holo-ACP synthase)